MNIFRLFGIVESSVADCILELQADGFALNSGLFASHLHPHTHTEDEIFKRRSSASRGLVRNHLADSRSRAHLVCHSNHRHCISWYTSQDILVSLLATWSPERRARGSGLMARRRPLCDKVLVQYHLQDLLHQQLSVHNIPTTQRLQANYRSHGRHIQGGIPGRRELPTRPHFPKRIYVPRNPMGIFYMAGISRHLAAIVHVAADR